MSLKDDSHHSEKKQCMPIEGTPGLDDINSLSSHLSGVFAEGDNTATAHPQHCYYVRLSGTQNRVSGGPLSETA